MWILVLLSPVITKDELWLLVANVGWWRARGGPQSPARPCQASSVPTPAMRLSPGLARICPDQQDSVNSQVWKVQLDQWLPLRHCAPSLRLPRHVWCWQVFRYFVSWWQLITIFFFRFYLGYPAIGLLKFSTLGFFFIGHLVCVLTLNTWNILTSGLTPFFRLMWSSSQVRLSVQLMAAIT